MGERLGQMGFGELGSSYDSWLLWIVERRYGGDVCWPVLYVVLHGHWIESGFYSMTTNLEVGLGAVVGGRLGRSRKGLCPGQGLDHGVGTRNVRQNEQGLRLDGGGSGHHGRVVIYCGGAIGNRIG